MPEAGGLSRQVPDLTFPCFRMIISTYVRLQGCRWPGVTTPNWRLIQPNVRADGGLRRVSHRGEAPRQRWGTTIAGGILRSACNRQPACLEGRRREFMADQTEVCEQCGKPLNDGKHPARRNCSGKQRRAARRMRVSKTCLGCGKQFELHYCHRDRFTAAASA